MASALTIVLRVDPEAPSPAHVVQAAAVLRAGGLVGMPTETVYGLAARGLHPAEVAKIFAAKGRPATHPLILHVDGEAMAASLARGWSASAAAFALAFWPGPLTLVVPRAPSVPDAVTGGLHSVGLRAPRHPVALALVRAVGEPLAAPSANAHMHVSPTRAEHVLASLGDAVDLVLDAGPCSHGIESTVLDLTSDVPRVLRPGATSLEALRSIDPRVAYASVTVAPDTPRASPGLASKHYSPRAPVVLVTAGEVVARVRECGSLVRVLVWSDDAARALASAGFEAHTRQLPSVAEPYAAVLFAALHEADADGASQVVIERVPDHVAWWAVADRLARAATR